MNHNLDKKLKEKTEIKMQKGKRRKEEKIRKKKKWRKETNRKEEKKEKEEGFPTCEEQIMNFWFFILITSTPNALNVNFIEPNRIEHLIITAIIPKCEILSSKHNASD